MLKVGTWEEFPVPNLGNQRYHQKFYAPRIPLELLIQNNERYIVIVLVAEKQDHVTAEM